MSTFSPNLNIEEVARGGDVGTWDTPTNSNWTLMDSALGAIATIPLNNSNIVLSAAQFQSKTLTFNSTLTGSVTVTLPTSYTKSYEIRHLCTGSSAFTITLETTATGGQVICAVPGQSINVTNDGTNIYYHNFGGAIGSYMDWGGSSLPNWVSGCTVQPYLNCDGTSISSLAATYPVLNGMLGGTLPDRRGTVGMSLNQGTARATIFIAGDTIASVGGSELVTLVVSQIPAHSHVLTDPGHLHGTTIPVAGSGATYTTAANGPASAQTITGPNTGTATTGITIANTGGSSGHGNLQPTTVYGLSLIRAG